MSNVSLTAGAGAEALVPTQTRLCHRPSVRQDTGEGGGGEGDFHFHLDNCQPHYLPLTSPQPPASGRPDYPRVFDRLPSTVLLPWRWKST